MQRNEVVAPRGCGGGGGAGGRSRAVRRQRQRGSIGAEGLLNAGGGSQPKQKAKGQKLRGVHSGFGPRRRTRDVGMKVAALNW